MSGKKGSRSRLPGVDSQESSRWLGGRSGKVEINADLVGLEWLTPRGHKSLLRSAGRCRKAGAGEGRVALDSDVGCPWQCWPMKDQADSPHPTLPSPFSILCFGPLAPSRSSGVVWALWGLLVSSPYLRSYSSACNLLAKFSHPASRNKIRYL